MARGDSASMARATPAQDDFSGLRELVRCRQERELTRGSDYNKPALVAPRSHALLAAIRPLGGRRVVALRPPRWVSRLLEAAEPSRRGTALAFAAGFLAPLFGLAALVAAVPAAQVKWAQAVLEGPPVEAEWAETTPRILNDPGKPLPSAGAIAQAIAALRYEGTSAREPAPPPPDDKSGPVIEDPPPPAARGLVDPAVPPENPAAGAETTTQADPPATAPFPRPAVAALASAPAEPAVSPLTKPAAEEVKPAGPARREEKRPAATGERRPPSAEPAARAREEAPRATSGAKLARLKEAPAHLRGPGNAQATEPAGSKKPAKAAARPGPQKGYPPPLPPKSVLLVPPPPPPQPPGLFQSIGSFLGL
jgi:hypothetical protein